MPLIQRLVTTPYIYILVCNPYVWARVVRKYMRVCCANVCIERTYEKKKGNMGKKTKNRKGRNYTRKKPHVIILKQVADHKYLLLAEFSVRTVNYGPSFFPSIYGPSAKRGGHKSMEKNEDP